MFSEVTATSLQVILPAFIMYLVTTLVVLRSAIFGAASLKVIRCYQLAIILIIDAAYICHFTGVLPTFFTVGLRAMAIPSLLVAWIWPIIKTDHVSIAIGDGLYTLTKRRAQIDELIERADDVSSPHSE